MINNHHVRLSQVDISPSLFLNLMQSANLPSWGHIPFLDAVLESCSLAFHLPQGKSVQLLPVDCSEAFWRKSQWKSDIKCWCRVSWGAPALLGSQLPLRSVNTEFPGLWGALTLQLHRLCHQCWSECVSPIPKTSFNGVTAFAQGWLWLPFSGIICLLLLIFKLVQSQPKTWPCKTFLTQTVSK